jgi:hypothetical protein
LRLSRSRISGGPHAAAGDARDPDSMKTSYAVKWREPGGHTYLGKLEFGPKSVVLEGRNGDERGVRRTIAFEELNGFRIGLGEGERLDGQPTLVVDGPGGELLVTSAVMHAGVLQELVHRLSELRVLAPRVATVVLPLADGALDRARELAAQGPPFDPDEAQLVRHQLLLTPHEAIFVFESESVAELETLLGRLDLWAAAASWRGVAAGPPRLAETAYAWER